MKMSSGDYRGTVNPQRRRLLQQAPLLGLGALLGEDAQAARRRQSILPNAESDILALWADTLVPGAKAAGVVPFVIDQLSRPRDAACLTLRYLDWPGDYAGFYRQGIAAIEAAAQSSRSSPFSALAASQRTDLVGAILAGKIENWQGPPAGLFYFVTRSDAVDVVYGTVSGFARLDIPYRPHIVPPLSWPVAA
jgi:hypothetical protein